jgi:hypothetical protein
MINNAWYLYVSRNVASQSAGGLRAGSIPQKAKFILTSRAHVG